MAIDKLRVFGVPWHVAHQFELAKLFKQYDLIINPYRSWGERSRPMPDNVQYVDKFNPELYDFVILHVDQQSIYNPDKGDRISKGRLYQDIRETIGDSLPIVTINHMTPFHDKYESPYVVKTIKELTKGTTVVCNSYEAANQWGFGRTIIHGMTSDDWWDLPKEPRCITVLSPAGMEKAYRRTFLHAVIRKLKDMGVPYFWVGVDKKFSNFDDYRDFLGRSLVFFMPTWQSPRPRARTEAMFSGSCVVTTGYQDADTYFEHGVNGFLTSKAPINDPRIMDNPEYTAKMIKRLVIDEPEKALEVGQKGKEYAQKHFSTEKFKKQWVKLLKDIKVL